MRTKAVVAQLRARPGVHPLDAPRFTGLYRAGRDTRGLSGDARRFVHPTVRIRLSKGTLVTSSVRTRRRFAFASSFSLVAALSASAYAQVAPQPEHASGAGDKAAAPLLEAQMNALMGLHRGADVRPGSDEGTRDELRREGAASTRRRLLGLLLTPRHSPMRLGSPPRPGIPASPTSESSRSGTCLLRRVSPHGSHYVARAERHLRAQPVANERPVALTFPDNQWDLEASAVVPLSDYVFKLAKQYSGAEHSAEAAELTERAAELTSLRATRASSTTRGPARGFRSRRGRCASSRRALTTRTRRTSTRPGRPRKPIRWGSRPRSRRTSCSSCVRRTLRRWRRIASARRCTTRGARPTRLVNRCSPISPDGRGARVWWPARRSDPETSGAPRNHGDSARPPKPSEL